MDRVTDQVLVMSLFVTFGIRSCIVFVYTVCDGVCSSMNKGL